MKIYIAAPYSTRDDAIHTMKYLEDRGHVVTSRWLKEADQLDDASAQKDLDDVEAADVLLAVNEVGWENLGTGGRHVELGYALALGKQVVLLGKQSNIFHYLDRIRVIEQIEDL